MKEPIIEILELGEPKSIIQRAGEPISELIDTGDLVKELNEQLHIPVVVPRTFSRNEVDRLLKVQRDKCSAKATHFANEKADSTTIFNYVNSTPIEDF